MAWLRDTRDGWRSIRRTPTLSLAVMLTLVVGVSMNSVVFSVFNGLLFRPAVTRDPSSFIQLYVESSGAQREWQGPQWLATLDDLATARSATHTLAAVTASRWASFSLASEGASLRGAFVSCNYLAIHLGAIRAGRGLLDTDCASASGDAVAVLTERGWRTYFASDPAILGRTITVNNHALTVVGIAPDDAVGPVAAMLYVPYTLQPVLQGPTDFFRQPAGRHAWLTLSGRLRPGRTAVEAQAELDVITSEFGRRHRGQTLRMVVTDGAIIHAPETARSMPALMALSFATTGVILMLVCANVTTLLLARAVARRQEMALRLCLGAGRGQLLRQLVTETAMLGGGAGIVGIVLAWFLPNRVAQMLTEFPLQESFGPDGRAIALTLGLGVLAGGVAGLSPAFETLRFGGPAALRFDGRVSSGHMSPRLSGLLITNQLSISLALLIVLAMIGRAQHRLLSGRFDYDPATVIVTNVDLTRTGYTGSAAQTYYDRLAPAIEALPGVRAIAFSSPAPFQGVARRAIYSADGGTRSVLVAYRAVTPGFFAMLNVRLLEGRMLTDGDARVSGRVTPMIISSAFAQRYFSGTSSLGHHLRLGEGERGEIVGVVTDTVSLRAGESDEPIVYEPLYGALVGKVTPLLQTAAAASDVADMIRARAAALDARAWVRPQTIAAMIADQTSRYAAVIRVTAIPAGLAVFLSLAGIYGLTSFTVAQRTHEIGVRVACGARPLAVLGLFLRRLQRPLLAGLAGGTLFSFGAGWTLKRTALHLDLPSLDASALAAATSVLLVAALVAAAIPVLRVARAEPWRTLND